MYGNFSSHLIYLKGSTQKNIILLDVCRSPQIEVAIRATIGIIPIFQIYRRRCPYPELKNRLKLLSDNIDFNRVYKSVTGYIALMKQKITKGLMKKSFRNDESDPMIGKR